MEVDEADENEDLWVFRLICHSTCDESICRDDWITNYWNTDLRYERLEPQVSEHLMFQNFYDDERQETYTRSNAGAVIKLEELPFFKNIYDHHACNGGVYTCSSFFVYCDPINWRYLIVCNDCFGSETFGLEIVTSAQSTWEIEVHLHSDEHLHCSVCGWMCNTYYFCRNTEDISNNVGEVDGTHRSRSQIRFIFTNNDAAEAA